MQLKSIRYHRKSGLTLLLAAALFLFVNAVAVFAQTQNTNSAAAKRPADFVPAGYKVLQEAKGDLNKDGLEDCVLLIVGKQDKSRRGIVIAFNTGEHYENTLENRNIFSYGKDDYFITPPDVEIAVKNGVLNINTEFRHGMGAIFNSYIYKFRYQDSDFELIGYDDMHYHPVYGAEKRSINLLSQKIQTKTIESADNGGRVSGEAWKDIIIKEPVKLRKIASLNEFTDTFHIDDYITVK